jgi:hypothetical protein
MVHRGSWCTIRCGDRDALEGGLRDVATMRRLGRNRGGGVRTALLLWLRLYLWLSRCSGAHLHVKGDRLPVLLLLCLMHHELLA